MENEIIFEGLKTNIKEIDGCYFSVKSVSVDGHKFLIKHRQLTNFTMRIINVHERFDGAVLREIEFTRNDGVKFYDTIEPEKMYSCFLKTLVQNGLISQATDKNITNIWHYVFEQSRKEQQNATS